MKNELRNSNSVARRPAGSSANANQIAQDRNQVTAGAEPSDDPASQSINSEAAFNRWVGKARALDAREVQVLHGDVRLAVRNATDGMNAVLAVPLARRAELPKADFEAMAKISDLGLALLFAASRSTPNTSPVDIAKLLARARELRVLLLATADALAAKGLFPQSEVDDIHEGRGPYDTAQDCVELAALFNKYAGKVQGKHALEKKDLDEAAQVGSQLMVLLKPKSAPRRPKPADLKQATDDRDRLWTLLMQLHAEIWRAGAWYFGQAGVDENVRPLLARQGGRPVTKSGTGTAPARKTSKQRQAEARAAVAARKAVAAEKQAAKKKEKADRAAAKALALATRSKKSSTTTT